MTWQGNPQLGKKVEDVGYENDVVIRNTVGDGHHRHLHYHHSNNHYHHQDSYKNVGKNLKKKNHNDNAISMIGCCLCIFIVMMTG